LRWNRLESEHRDGKGISADPRADASSQKQKSAADRQSDHLEKTWQEAKAAGKEVHVPKWVRVCPFKVNIPVSTTHTTSPTASFVRYRRKSPPKI